MISLSTTSRVRTDRHVPLESAAAARTLGISLYRCQSLAYSLVSAVAAMAAARPAQLSREQLDAYLHLSWLHWEGGQLKLTPHGARVCMALA